MQEISLQKLDEELFLLFNQLHTPATDQFWLLITHPIHWLALFIGVSVLVFLKQPIKKASIQLFSLYLSVALTYMITQLVKNLIARPRPSAINHIIKEANIIYEPQQYSFFSGHAATSFAATIFLVLLLKNDYPVIKWLFIWPILFSISRIFVGVHFPSDIIVGAVFGVFMGVTTFKCLEYLKLTRQSQAISNRE